MAIGQAECLPRARVRKVLIVAAEAREFSGLLRLIGSYKPLGWPVAFGRRAAWNGMELTLVANGPGPKLAGAAMDAARAAGESNVDAVVSFGYCGALNPSLRIGDIFAAAGIDSPANGRTYAVDLPDTDQPFQRGRLLSTDRFANSAVEKASLRRSGADAVDMEAAAVAEWAHSRSLGFYCLRAVTDTAYENFRLDFNTVRDADGRFDRGRIALRALARPWSVVPELIRLDRHCRLAARNLGEFFADCRF